MSLYSVGSGFSSASVFDRLELPSEKRRVSRTVQEDHPRRLDERELYIYLSIFSEDSKLRIEVSHSVFRFFVTLGV